MSAELVAAVSRLPRGPQVALKPFTPLPTRSSPFCSLNTFDSAGPSPNSLTNATANRKWCFASHSSASSRAARFAPPTAARPLVPPFLHSEKEKGSNVNEVTLTALTALSRFCEILSVISLHQFSTFARPGFVFKNLQDLTDPTSRISLRCHAVIVPAIQERQADRVPLDEVNTPDERLGFLLAESSTSEARPWAYFT